MANSDSQHPTVVVDRVSRRFEVAVELPRTRDGTSHLRRLASTLRPRPKASVHALRKVSFVAHSGEAIGIVGTNGSGKSTLLRLIAGLDVPDQGEISATSQPMLLGVGAALQQELSGITNIRLGLLALGFTPEKVQGTIPRVLEIAGIGEAIYRPIRTYSSGMSSRLRFAIAAAAEPEILLLDEILSTGDAASVQRAEQRMAEIRERAGTVFLVSHAAKTIQETCTRALWLHNGTLIQDGPAEETAEAYRWWAWNVAQGEIETADNLLEKALEARRGVAEAEQEVEELHPETQESPTP
ncbi:ABC transporter ATP-binding protein [Ornithinimicrobium sufpigmenti]|uniref:ABC transporter ATP-binding protein n=1 Tax=Ornithinimicrobium sufpigmenti TaxID=2508882 RepID=UPI00103661A9|nr:MULTISPECIES: ABC transporter ATP-binding protein [unclassified Ornithinimicrobium]